MVWYWSQLVDTENFFVIRVNLVHRLWFYRSRDKSKLGNRGSIISILTSRGLGSIVHSFVLG